MTVDERIRAELLRASAALPRPDTTAALEDVTARARAGRRRTAALVSAAAGAALVASVAVVGALLGPDDQEDRPVPPSPAATHEPPELTRQRDESRLPVVRSETSPAVERGSEPDSVVHRVWEDPADSEVPWSDIRAVTVTDAGTVQVWELDLGRHPVVTGWSATMPDLEYGIVVDTDGDRRADCELGISTVTPAPHREFRTWSIDRDDGTVREQVGPPYGVPFEFHHPYEGGRVMTFMFGTDLFPCSSPTDAVHVYVWSAVLEEGRVVALDLAPDDAWLAMEPLGARPTRQE